VHRLVCLVALTAAACGTSGIEVRALPKEGPFDAVVIPGCPTTADGHLTRCQVLRAVFGAELWKKGWTRNLITSGGAAHTPYVEAEALALALAALGVPPEHIWLEPSALHTDENMWASWQVARALGFQRIAVASNREQAIWGCRMMMDFGGRCHAFGANLAELRPRLEADGPRLLAMTAPRVGEDPWIPLRARERARARETGIERPPSFILYPYIGFLRLNGDAWIPYAPPIAPKVNWADRIRQLRR
jgi:hypothetical protein